MTEPGNEQPTSRPWQWPREWFRDEKFWRDVGSRTLAAVIAAGIIYLFAVAGGYVARPKTLPFLALLADITVGAWWYGMTTKLKASGWYYTKPHWLLRLIDYALNFITVIIVLWILNVFNWFQ